jgi:hypothetical protein
MNGFRIVLAGLSSIIAFIAIFVVVISEFKKNKEDYPHIKYYLESLISSLAAGLLVFFVMGIL